jgi:hypothetical protein
MISRDERYKMVWSKPVTKIAERFGLSGSYMARICSIVKVPKPERGYWAKLAVGKAPGASAMNYLPRRSRNTPQSDRRRPELVHPEQAHRAPIS